MKRFPLRISAQKRGREGDKGSGGVRIFIWDVNLKASQENTPASRTFVDLHLVGRIQGKNSVPKSHQ